MNRPLEVIDMQNITLQSWTSNTANVRPLLVPQFPCEVHDQCREIRNPYRIVFKKFGITYKTSASKISLCCSALHLINVALAHIDGIQIAVNLPYYMSGLIIEQSTDVHISNTALTPKSQSRKNASGHEFGLLVFNSSRIAVESLRANKFSCGIVTYKSNSIDINNIMIQNCIRMGVLIFHSDSVSVVNLLSQNNRYGLVSASTKHIIITNSTLMNNSQNGITLIRTDNNVIPNFFGIPAFNVYDFNIHGGRDLTHCSNTTLKGIHIAHNAGIGLQTYSCTNLTMINIIVKHGNDFAMKIQGGIVIMENVYAFNNFKEISIYYAESVYMENVSTEHNQGHGIYLFYCNILIMSLVLSNYNANSGIVVNGCRQGILINSSSIGNHERGIQLEYAENTRIQNLLSKYNGDHGVIAALSTNAILTDSNFVHNKYGHISLNECTDFSIIRTAASIIVHQSKDIYFAETIFFEMSSSISTTADLTSIPVIVELYKSTAKVYS